jgi:hypothetical protein
MCVFKPLSSPKSRDEPAPRRQSSLPNVSGVARSLLVVLSCSKVVPRSETYLPDDRGMRLMCGTRIANLQCRKHADECSTERNSFGVYTVESHRSFTWNVPGEMVKPNYYGKDAIRRTLWKIGDFRHDRRLET